MFYRKNFFSKAVRILVITNSMVLLAAGMVAPIYAIFVEKIGGDIMEAGIAGTIFALVAGITTIFSGKISDKSKNKQKIVSLGYALMALGFILYIFVDSIWFLFVVQAIIGLGEAVYSPAFDALFSDNVCKTKESREWGLWESSYYFSIAIGAILGAWLASVFGFNILFAFMGIISLISSLYLFFTPASRLKSYNN